MSEALNHPRSLAVEYFIRFGFLARQRNADFDLSVLKRALEARFLSKQMRLCRSLKGQF